MKFTVERIQIEPFDVIRREIPFEDGVDDFVTGLRFDASCGCRVEVGMRVIKGEKSMLSWPCATHDDGWATIFERFLDTEKPTDEALAEALEAASA